MSQVFLAFGSNLGNRRQNIFTALRLLEQKRVFLQKFSTIIETDPVGGPPQARFLNAVGHFETSLLPKELLTAIHEIELNLGRERIIPNGPRPIDIDILTYDHLTINEKDLIIPHPRMKERNFVMIPLLEIHKDENI